MPLLFSCSLHLLVCLFLYHQPIFCEQNSLFFFLYMTFAFFYSAQSYQQKGNNCDFYFLQDLNYPESIMTSMARRISLSMGASWRNLHCRNRSHSLLFSLLFFLFQYCRGELVGTSVFRISYSERGAKRVSKPVDSLRMETLRRFVGTFVPVP